MKQENNQNTRVGKYSDLREEIESSKNSRKTTRINRETTKIKKSETLSNTITVPIDNNNAMETRTIYIEKEGEVYKNTEIFNKYKKRRTFFIVLYCLGGSLVLALFIFVLVLIIGK